METSIGQRFGRLVVLGEHRCSNSGRLLWKCLCDCGVETVKKKDNIRSGNTTSCGCFNSETLKSRYKDLTGNQYGRLTVLNREENIGTKVRWKCLCSCGNTTIVYYSGLVYGRTTSCGCKLTEVRGQSSITHGQSGTPMYNAWKTMFRRCETPTNTDYMNYGGRGIKVCPEWKDFEVFARDMGERPEGTTLERIDNNGNYCRGNCRWATRADQARNRRSSIWYEFEGEKVVETDFAVRIGMKQGAVAELRRKGYTMEQILLRSKGVDCDKPENTASPRVRNNTPKPRDLSEFANLPYLGRL